MACLAGKSRALWDFVQLWAKDALYGVFTVGKHVLFRSLTGKDWKRKSEKLLDKGYSP